MGRTFYLSSAWTSNALISISATPGASGLCRASQGHAAVRRCQDWGGGQRTPSLRCGLFQQDVQKSDNLYSKRLSVRIFIQGAFPADLSPDSSSSRPCFEDTEQSPTAVDMQRASSHFQDKRRKGMPECWMQNDLRFKIALERG